MQHRSSRDWVFAAVAWLMFAGAIAGIFTFAAATEDAPADDGGLWAGITALFFGPPLAIGGASLVIFGWRRRIKNAFGLAGWSFGVIVAAFMLLFVSPGFLHGPRYLLMGSARGTLAEVARLDAAWVEITPAFVDTSQIGQATDTSSDSKGRSRTRQSVVAPILTAHGERDPDAAREPAVLFLCDDDADELRAAARGGGTVAGRMYRPDFLELRAMDEVKRARGTAAPRCVVPGRTGSRFWAIAWILVVLVASTAGSALVRYTRAPPSR